jgi:hypothetical protein
MSFKNTVATRFQRADSVLRAEKGGPVAQWLELTAHNRLVGGSSPSGPTISLTMPLRPAVLYQLRWQFA